MKYVINTERINYYADIISKAFVKGDPRSESVYVNVSNGNLYFHYLSRYQGKLSISVEESPDTREDDEEDIQGFWVNLPAFLALCSEYPEFSIDPHTGEVFQHNDSYHISTIVEEHLPIDFSAYEEGEHFELTDSDKRAIHNAISFTPSGKGVIEDRDYSGIAIIENSVTGSDSITLYEGYLNFSVGKRPMLFGPEVNGLFNHVSAKGGSVDIYRRTYEGGREHYFVFLDSSSNNGEMVIAYAPYNSLHYPAVNDPAFREKFEHDTHVTTSAKALNGTLRFFSRFKDSGTSESYVKLHIGTKDSNPALYVGYTTSKNAAMREIPGSEADVELIDHESDFEHSSLQQALRLGASENDDTVEIYLPSDDSKPAVDVKMKATEDREHIVLRRFKS